MARQVRRASRYRFHPTDGLAVEYTRRAFVRREGGPPLARMAGPLGIRWSRPLPEGAEPSSVTVSRDSAGRWFVSIPRQDTITVVPTTDAAVGGDAGITSLVALSSGDKIANPCPERRDRARRDVNAARSIPSAGPAASACGDGVGPQRDTSRTGHSSAKQ